jgi:hypothetical protein
MTEHLDVGGYTWNGLASNSADDEALGWIPKRAAPRLRLHSAALWIESHGVKVELLVGASKNEPNRQMIFAKPEAERPKRLLDPRDISEGDHQIEVLVRSRFAPE